MRDSVLPVKPLEVANKTIQMQGHQLAAKTFGCMQRIKATKKRARRKTGQQRMRLFKPSNVNRGKVLPMKSKNWKRPTRRMPNQSVVIVVPSWGHIE